MEKSRKAFFRDQSFSLDDDLRIVAFWTFLEVLFECFPQGLNISSDTPQMFLIFILQSGSQGAFSLLAFTDSECEIINFFQRIEESVGLRSLRW